MYRTSNSASIKAQAEIRKYLRLLAYRDEFAPDYDPDWGDAKVNKFYVVHDEKNPEWKAANNTYFKNPIVVYLPKDVALVLVKKLNSGEVLL